jgi:isopentenyl-diphosphate delta-isomerase
MEDAIRRRAKFELGIEEGLEDIRCLLPTYRYTTPPYNGIIENEFCPVYVAYYDGVLDPNPDEVEMYRWLPWSEYAFLLTDPKLSQNASYWAKDQYEQLQYLEPFVALP